MSQYQEGVVQLSANTNIRSFLSAIKFIVSTGCILSAIWRNYLIILNWWTKRMKVYFCITCHYIVSQACIKIGLLGEGFFDIRGKMGKGVHYLMDKYTSKYIPEWKLYILEYILLLTENKFRKENLWIETSILSRVVKHPIVQWKISLIAEETWFSLIHRQIKTGEPNALGIAHILYVLR